MELVVASLSLAVEDLRRVENLVQNPTRASPAQYRLSCSCSSPGCCWHRRTHAFQRSRASSLSGGHRPRRARRPALPAAASRQQGRGGRVSPRPSSARARRSAISVPAYCAFVVPRADATRVPARDARPLASLARKPVGNRENQRDERLRVAGIRTQARLRRCSRPVPARSGAGSVPPWRAPPGRPTATAASN